MLGERVSRGPTVLSLASNPANARFACRRSLPPLSLPFFSPKQRDFLGKWPRSCPKWQRVVNACLRAFLPLTVARHCWRLLASFHSSASSTYHESHPRLNKASQISSLRISLSLKQIFLSKRYRVIELINWRRDSPSRILVGTWILEYNQIVSLPR